MAPSETLPSVGALRLDFHGGATAFCPGDDIDGIVHLDLDTPVSYATLMVHVVGRQELHWMYTTSHLLRSPHKHSFFHLDFEFPIGDLNTTLSAGTHALPFTISLPTDLIANDAIEKLVIVDHLRNAFLTVEYTIRAQLEVAGLSNAKLTQTHPFTITRLPTAVPLGIPVTSETSEEITTLGIHKGGTCNVRMTLEKDVADLASRAPVAVLVEIRVPLKHTPHGLKLVLYEDFFIDTGSKVEDGTHYLPRAVCSRKYKLKDLIEWSDDHWTTLEGRLEFVIKDSNAEAFDPLAPSATSKFIQIRHRLGLEVAFLLGRTVKTSVAITLVKRPSAVVNS